MSRNHIYTFQRPPSEEMPPRFGNILLKLEEIGIDMAMLSHPQRDWNRIELTIGSKNNARQIEGVFREFGYSLSEK